LTAAHPIASRVVSHIVAARHLARPAADVVARDVRHGRERAPRRGGIRPRGRDGAGARAGTGAVHVHGDRAGARASESRFSPAFGRTHPSSSDLTPPRPRPLPLVRVPPLPPQSTSPLFPAPPPPPAEGEDEPAEPPPRPALKIRYAFPGKPDEPVDEGPFESRDDGAFACDATRTFAFLPATDRPSITTLLNAPLTLTLSRDDDVAIATARVPFDGFLEVRSISHWSPYDPVRVVNADP
jgi:hypothetical protein